MFRLPAAFLIVTAIASAVLAQDASDRYAGLDNDRYFDGALETLATVKADKVFTEGPAVDRAGVCYFTNTAGEAILRWNPADKKLTVFREDSGAANGLAFDRQGRLIACEGNRSRVTRTDMQAGKIEVLADNWMGQSLGKVNDEAIDLKGRIYFTGRFPHPLQEGQAEGVYRIDPDGKVERIIASPDIDMPNGLVTSPDDKTLYLIDADGRKDHARRIRAYDLKPRRHRGQ